MNKNTDNPLTVEDALKWADVSKMMNNGIAPSELDNSLYLSTD